MVYFEKTQPAPSSLATEKAKGINGDYKKNDVQTQLKNDFYDKCYICEAKGIHAINVEHFDPHEDRDVNKKFDWDNLLWSCSHCNGIKSNRHINLLKCTIETDNVDTNIKYHYNFKVSPPHKKIIVEAIASDDKTVNTVRLLQLVYQGTEESGIDRDTTEMRKHQSGAIREKLFNEISAFRTLVDKYYFTQYHDEKEDALYGIEKKLTNRSPFSAFKRYIIRNDSEYNRDLGHLI
jgi:uncharacterized protein (TIGR02646 family)